MGDISRYENGANLPFTAKEFPQPSPRDYAAENPCALARQRYHFGKGKGVLASKKRELRFSFRRFRR